MQRKKSINLGFRGWMLVLYQAIAFVSYQAFTNYPLNILSDLYGGAQRVSTIYTVCGIVGILIQLLIASYIGKMNKILLLLFKPERVKATDDKYRKAAGKPLDHALVGRK